MTGDATPTSASSRQPEVVERLEVYDVRFPTSLELDGSDAMNPSPDYSAAYLTLHTSRGAQGHAFVFTLGRGNELQVAAIQALEPLVVGCSVDDTINDTAALSRRLAGDSQFRWLGPEKGSVHMAAGAILNAVWDLAARRAGKPLWRLLAEMSPERIVGLVDFTYLRDALTEVEALQLLEAAEQGRAARTRDLLENGCPAYSTSAGWLGYDDEKVERLCRQAAASGFEMIKLKVGADLADDIRRLSLARSAVGAGVKLAVDANQVWGVQEAIDWVHALAPWDPYWVEEPTSPDDVLGHAAIRRSVVPIRVATGEQCANAVMFKQLLQAGAVDVVQIDACRVAGVNENVAILLLAAKYGIPVCPHAGGVGLCEIVQHLSMFDFVAVSGSHDGRWVEFVDHLHEHFVEPVDLRAGRYRAPIRPGSGAEMHRASIDRFRYPDGAAWAGDATDPSRREASTSV